MGTAVHAVVVGGPPDLVDRAVARIGELERRWSRFSPTSEITWLNAMAGKAVAVSAETRLLVTCALLGWERSAGLFDPTVHDAVAAAGYDRSFADLPADAPGRPSSPPVPGCQGVTVDEPQGTVRLPAGVHIDPGGIGKGLAADLVVDELLRGGAAGVCVNIGGDLRVSGESPDGAAWRVAVPRPASTAGPDEAPWGVLVLEEGAVATSSIDRRRWTAGGREMHHLIDPATGLPARTPVVSATAIAGTAWEAEVAAKSAVLAGSVADQTTTLTLAHGAVLFDDAGGATTIGSLPLGPPRPAVEV